ncbi:hypothetical protein [Leptospira noguchii]|uniref:Uncharacterized protein n=1 Tax=Leptospira noguchii TaxID=28182 RepID=M6VP35_9LEPT|nr:hypothetical protein [Leptospira noguchii]EMO54824.1 hypothetical protein LEP1GSC172_4306 [Leptospira noguchii]
MNLLNELSVVTTLVVAPVKKSFTKTQLYETFQPGVYPLNVAMNQSQTMLPNNYSLTQSDVILPFFDLTPRPMRDLDAEETEKYNSFINSKKKVIKKSII